MDPIEPLQTAHLFLPLHQELLGLLRSLSHEDWERPTAAAGWSVRDMVAHLLDTDLRRLSFQRDGLAPLAPSAPIVTDRDLVAFLDELNATSGCAAVGRQRTPGSCAETTSRAATLRRLRPSLPTPPDPRRLPPPLAPPSPCPSSGGR